MEDNCKAEKYFIHRRAIMLKRTVPMAAKWTEPAAGLRAARELDNHEALPQALMETADTTFESAVDETMGLNWDFHAKRPKRTNHGRSSSLASRLDK